MARTLSNSGYTNVRIVRGGYDGWKLVGGPVEEKVSVTAPPATPALAATPTPPNK